MDSVRGSTPLAFPSSSTAAPSDSANANHRLFAPSSGGLTTGGASGTSTTYRRLRAGQQRDSSPLFFPGSDGIPTPRQAPRGDIRGSAGPRTPSSSNANNRQNRDHPSSSAAALSAIASDDRDVDEEDMNVPKRVVWGTTVVLLESENAFKKFLRGFKAKHRHAGDQARVESAGGNPDGITFGHVREDGEKPIYEDYLRRMRLSGQTNLNLDILDLLSFPATFNLYQQLLTYPQAIIPSLDQTLKDQVIKLAEADLVAIDGGYDKIDDETLQAMDLSTYKIRPFGGERSINMRDLNPGDIDKLVTIKGLVIRATPIIPDMKTAFFRCLTCQHSVIVEIDRGQIAEPDRCPREVCGGVSTMSLVHNRCGFSDRQVVRLQETPDSVPDGQTPHTVSLCLYDEYVDLVKPGDRICLTGIFLSVPIRINPRQRVIKSLFKTYVDVVHVSKSNAKRMGVDTSTRQGDARRGVVGVGGEEGMAEEDGMDLDDIEYHEELDPERRTKAMHARAAFRYEIVELSTKPDIYDLLSRSLAPSIWGMDDVKKGILLQLFGGTNKTIARGGGGGGPRYRGDINVLLVGDPGTSKSQILQYIHKIAPRGVYCSGKGSSAVGLTAYVTRDPDSKQLVLESGALVLSDGGVCCIDEFDKMSDATRSVLHEVMEQQTVSIAKAGIITTLNARTSILAAANPVGSKYNLNWPITRNLDLPPTLISRFDLLYLVLDKIDEVGDRKLARFLVGLYLEDQPDTGGTDVIKVELLSAYISYARNTINPVLTEGASQALVKAYVDMRNLGADPRTNDRRITATTRQLESMIRLSEAHARMRFSKFVELEDVTEANRLIREALKESATDPLTGLIDLDLLNTGQGLQQRKLRGDLRREVLSMLEIKDSGNRGMRWNEVVKSMEAQSSLAIDLVEFAEVVRDLEGSGAVKVQGEREKRTIRRTGGGGRMDD